MRNSRIPLSTAVEVSDCTRGSMDLEFSPIVSFFGVGGVGPGLFGQFLAKYWFWLNFCWEL